MTTVMDDISLTARRRIAAPAQRLYDAWLTPALAAKFMAMKAGDDAPVCEIDARVGGRFRIVMLGTGGEPIEHTGEYLDLVPGKRIVFSWNSKYVNPGTTVTLTFDEKDGMTDVTLTHVKFAGEGMRDGHEKGWNAILDLFAQMA